MVEPYMILTPILGLCILFIILTTWLVSKLNKIAEMQQAGITLKDLYNYYKTKISETEEEREKRAIRSYN